jgi:signal transduction histidine kinase
MNKTLVVVTFCVGSMIIPSCGFSQKKGMELIDSLEKAVLRQGEDTNKVLTLLALCGSLSAVDLNKAFQPVNEALRISNKLHYIRGIANSENNLGLFISDTGNTVGARQHFERSYTFNVQRNSKINVVNNLINIGRTYSYESDFPRAIEYMFRGLAVAEEIKSDQKMALAGNNLAGNFFKQHDYVKAIQYGRYTVEHGAKADDPAAVGKGLVFIAISYSALKDTAAAIQTLDSAIAVERRANLRVDLSDILGDRAALEYDPAKRLAMRLDVLKLIQEVNAGSTAHFLTLAAIGDDYRLLAKRASSVTEKNSLLKLADVYLIKGKSMAQIRNNPARLAEVLKMMVDLEEYEGQYKAALTDQQRMTAINDSLFSQDNKNQIAGLETKHTVALKDAELAVSELKLANQRKTAVGLVAGLAGFAVLGVLLYWQNRSRKRANGALQLANAELGKANAELTEANRVKARFFGILSHDLRGPVASLLHFLEIQKEAPHMLNEAQQATHRQEISASAENLLNTMEGMLLWSKQQMQSFRPSPKNVPVNELFDYVDKFVGTLEKVKLMFQPADGLTVFTDENYLRVIMQNLTSNAIKALKDRPDAAIEWKAKKEDGRIVLSIADNGAGLGSEYAKALYDESVAENARDGFGLHIIRDLAKAIRCQVEVRAESGKGTEFFLILPLT